MQQPDSIFVNIDIPITRKFGHIAQIFKMKPEYENSYKLQVYGILKDTFEPAPTLQSLMNKINSFIDERLKKIIVIDGLDGLLYSKKLIVLFRKANIFGISVFLMVKNKKTFWYADKTYFD